MPRLVDISDASRAIELSRSRTTVGRADSNVLQLLQRYPHFRPADVARALACMSTKGAVSDVDSKTPNRLLHTGKMLGDERNAHLLDRLALFSNQSSVTEAADRDFTDSCGFQLMKEEAMVAANALLPEHYAPVV